MTDREPGFYWVNIAGIWIVGEWTLIPTGSWQLTGTELDFHDDALNEIGPKIEFPKPDYVQVWLPTAIAAFKAGLMEDGMTDCAPIINSMVNNAKIERGETTMYLITSKPGMTPFAEVETVAEAIAMAIKARRVGLDGRIVMEDDEWDAANLARPADVRKAAELLGWDSDMGASEMDAPVSIDSVVRSYT